MPYVRLDADRCLREWRTPPNEFQLYAFEADGARGSEEKACMGGVHTSMFVPILGPWLI
jgi:hypothetical protein